MAGGTKSVAEIIPPKNTREWGKEIAQLYADIGNRKRDEAEARAMIKAATVACDFAHAETRRTATLVAAGNTITEVDPVETS